LLVTIHSALEQDLHESESHSAHPLNNSEQDLHLPESTTMFSSQLRHSVKEHVWQCSVNWLQVPHTTSPSATMACLPSWQLAHPTEEQSVHVSTVHLLHPVPNFSTL